MLVPYDIFLVRLILGLDVLTSEGAWLQTWDAEELWKAPYASRVHCSSAEDILYYANARPPTKRCTAGLNSTGGRVEQKASQFFTPYPSSPYAVIRRDTANIHISRQLLTV